MLFHAVLALASDDLFPFEQGGPRIGYGSLAGFTALAL